MAQAGTGWALSQSCGVEADFRQREHGCGERPRLLLFQSRRQKVPADRGHPLQHPNAVRAPNLNAFGIRHRTLEKMKARTLEAAKNPESSDPFLAIRSEREYDAAVARLDALVDEVSDNSKAPRYRLIETLSVRVEAYDREHDSLPVASGIEVLRLLIEEYGLTQTDLPEIGSQGVVSGGWPAAPSQRAANTGARRALWG